MPLSEPQENLDDFKLHPWYHALLAAPHVTPQPTASRNPPFPNTIQAYTFFSSTLFIPTGLRAMQSILVRKPFTPSINRSLILPSSALQSTGECFSSGTDSRSLDKPLNDTSSDEWLVLVSLGTGLNGPGGIIHGGLTMTLLDNAMAVRARRAAGEKPVLTTQYEAEFKRKIKAPCVVLCRAWLDETVMNVNKDGRERADGDDGMGEDEETIYTRGRVEDGLGNVYLEANARFARRRVRAKANL